MSADEAAIIFAPQASPAIIVNSPPSSAVVAVQVGRRGLPGSPAGVTSHIRTNNESFLIYAMQPVKFDGPTGCKLAQADDVLNIAFGLAKSNAAPGADLEIILIGNILNSDCTVATGGSALLENGSAYFLSQGAAGVITTVPPDGTGQICQYLGTAVGYNELMVQIARPMRV